MLLWFDANNKEKSVSIYHKPENPHFGPIFTPFGLKTSKKGFSKHIISANLRIFVAVAEIRKIQLVDFWKNLQNLILGLFGQKPQNKIFSKFFFIFLKLDETLRS